MIRNVLMLDLGRQPLPVSTPLDAATAKILALLPMKLWGCVPDVLSTRFERQANGYASQAERDFTTHCTLNLSDIGEAVKSAQTLAATKPFTGLAADTLSLEQFAQQVCEAIKDLGNASALLVDTKTFSRFLDLCNAHNALMTYTARVAYQVGYQEGLQAGRVQG